MLDNLEILSFRPISASMRTFSRGTSATSGRSSARSSARLSARSSSRSPAKSSERERIMKYSNVESGVAAELENLAAQAMKMHVPEKVTPPFMQEDANSAADVNSIRIPLVGY